MNSLALLLICIAIFIVAYVTYGAFLAKKFGIDPKRKTPAHTLRDDVDYCPTNSKVLLGHHFSSIAGAGPITGPIQAAIFGWLPVLLWIIIGSIFIGGVHDFGSLVASVRHDGKTIGEVIKVNIGEKGKKLFNIFGWVTIVLVVAAFTDICASTFAYDPAIPENLMGAQAGTASMLFIVLAVVFGFSVFKKGAKLSVASIIGIVLLLFCIYIGYMFPIIKLSKLGWQILLLIYIFLASTLPVWLLLQPRDYLCSFLLYGIIIGALLGIVIKRPAMELAAFNGFNMGGKTLFPFLFVTVACGAISGFHSLVSSSTTSKQIDKEEPDAKLIGYGSMLIEGIVAVIALIAVGYVTKAEGTPAVIFANGVGNFMSGFGIPQQVGIVFVTLCFSAFALTSLDTATRIGRYILQELCEGRGGKKNIISKNMYISTGITVLASFGLILYGYNKIWPIFGSANQLLAALALLAITAWLTKSGKKALVTIVPMILMFIVTLSALGLLIKDYIFSSTPNYILGIIALILFILAIVLIIEAYNTLVRNKNLKKNINKTILK
ncbi:carbon starvation protein A [Clostridium sp. UBA7503]|uniref:carbon starvation CstA family protein n=1 Tax=Clostridium sp. UBA7503 TaxID=1946377 RepID=UPI0032165FAF